MGKKVKKRGREKVWWGVIIYKQQELQKQQSGEV